MIPFHSYPSCHCIVDERICCVRGVCRWALATAVLLCESVLIQEKRIHDISPSWIPTEHIPLLHGSLGLTRCPGNRNYMTFERRPHINLPPSFDNSHTAHAVVSASPMHSHIVPAPTWMTAAPFPLALHTTPATSTHAPTTTITTVPAPATATATATPGATNTASIGAVLQRIPSATVTTPNPVGSMSSPSLHGNKSKISYEYSQHDRVEKEQKERLQVKEQHAQKKAMVGEHDQRVIAEHAVTLQLQEKEKVRYAEEQAKKLQQELIAAATMTPGGLSTPGGYAHHATTTSQSTHQHLHASKHNHHNHTHHHQTQKQQLSNVLDEEESDDGGDEEHNKPNNAASTSASSSSTTTTDLTASATSSTTECATLPAASLAITTPPTATTSLAVTVQSASVPATMSSAITATSTSDEQEQDTLHQHARRLEQASSQGTLHVPTAKVLVHSESGSINILQIPPEFASPLPPRSPVNPSRSAVNPSVSPASASFSSSAPSSATPSSSATSINVNSPQTKRIPRLQKEIIKLYEEGVTHLLFLITEAEFKEMGVEDRKLYAYASYLGMKIITVSMPPGILQVPLLIDLVRLCLGILCDVRGNKLVLISKGGFHRAGTLAACILCAFSYPVEQAIRVVRECRGSNAIGTDSREKIISKFDVKFKSVLIHHAVETGQLTQHSHSQPPHAMTLTLPHAATNALQQSAQHSVITNAAANAGIGVEFGVSNHNNYTFL